MPTRLNSATDAYRQNEADILGNGKDDTTSGNAGRTPVLDAEAGLASTTVATDGDLRTIDTAAEAIALDPADNTTGESLERYSRAFLLRWLVKLIQPLAGAVAGSEVQVDIVSAPTITVDGGVNATQQGPWTVTADTGLSQPLTDSQLRATAVPITSTSLDTLAGAVASGEVKTALRSLGTFTDRSASTSSTPGNWTVLSASNANRTRLFLRVPLSAAAPVTIGRGAVGAEVVYDEIQPGGAFLIQASAGLAIDTAAFNVRSTAASVAFIAHEHGA